MNRFASQAKQWYEARRDALSKEFTEVAFTENDWDPVRGGVRMDLEGSSLLVSICIWYKGDIDVQVLKRGTQEPISIEDRVVEANEDIGLLLDTCMNRIAALEIV
jgi:hypothetical protein